MTGISNDTSSQWRRDRTIEGQTEGWRDSVNEKPGGHKLQVMCMLDLSAR